MLFDSLSAQAKRFPFDPLTNTENRFIGDSLEPTWRVGARRATERLSGQPGSLRNEERRKGDLYIYIFKLHHYYFFFKSFNWRKIFFLFAES